MDADEAYFDAFATYYDAHYGATEIPDDVAFYVGQAEAADGPVLEVGCGTGRVYLELLRAGVDADGIDISAASLDVLREKAAAEGLDPSVRRADVTDFEPDRSYALVEVPFRAFLHLTTVPDQLAALESLHGALEPGGRLVLNAFTPSFEVICEQYGEAEATVFEHEGETYRAVSTTSLADEVAQTATIHTVLHGPDGERLTDQTTSIKLVSRDEFELLFRSSPFASWSVTGGFDGDPLASTGQEMVWVAER